MGSCQLFCHNSTKSAIDPDETIELLIVPCKEYTTLYHV